MGKQTNKTTSTVFGKILWDVISYTTENLNGWIGDHSIEEKGPGTQASPPDSDLRSLNTPPFFNPEKTQIVTLNHSFIAWNKSMFRNPYCYLYDWYTLGRAKPNTLPWHNHSLIGCQLPNLIPIWDQRYRSGLACQILGLTLYWYLIIEVHIKVTEKKGLPT